ncbi:MAG: hypothetical protein H6740_16875 [Alphaproteobacteria bacterium]|nr:hypothetical protein [Alphaproteobacteria bacterium]
MKNVVLVAPYFGGNMLHAVRCFAALPGVRLGLLTHEPAERVPADLKPKLAGHYQLTDSLDAGQLAAGARAFQQEWGHVDRLEGYLEQLQVPLGDARDATGIEGLSGQVARNFRDKHRMKQVLREAGLPVARQALIRGAEDARRFVAEVGFPIVIKPLDGAGAKNTLRASDEQSLAEALNRVLPRPDAPAQAEEFVRGDEHSFETVLVDGEAVWSSSTFYLPGPLSVLENEWMQYCILLPREHERPHVQRFTPINHAALRALGLRTGISHMEWFDRPQGPVVSEVGARPPGANILLVNKAAYGVDMWAKWAELQVFGRWEMPERGYAAACAFIRAQGRGRVVREVQGLEEVQRQVEGMVWAHQLPQPGQPRSSHYEGDGWVILRHPDTQRVVEGLRAVVTTLRVVAG